MDRSRALLSKNKSTNSQTIASLPKKMTDGDAEDVNPAPGHPRSCSIGSSSYLRDWLLPLGAVCAAAAGTPKLPPIEITMPIHIEGRRHNDRKASKEVCTHWALFIPAMVA